MLLAMMQPIKQCKYFLWYTIDILKIDMPKSIYSWHQFIQVWCYYALWDQRHAGAAVLTNIMMHKIWFYSISSVSYIWCCNAWQHQTMYTKRAFHARVYVKSSKFLIFIAGDAWVKLEKQDMWLNDISCSRFGQTDGPQTIEDCLVRCTGSCMAVTHVLSENPQRCCYKNANRWQKALTPDTCCNHYEPNRGDNGKQYLWS